MASLESLKGRGPVGSILGSEPVADPNVTTSGGVSLVVLLRSHYPLSAVGRENYRIRLRLLMFEPRAKDYADTFVTVAECAKRMNITVEQVPPVIAVCEITPVEAPN
jgi:hypothetical protein